MAPGRKVRAKALTTLRNCLVVQGKLDCLILSCCCDFHEQLTAYEEQFVAVLALFAISSVEAPLTEYEKMRDKEIMKNNQKMASLGIRGIANQMKKKSARSKDNGPKLLGSLFNPQGSDGGEDNEGSEQEITTSVAKDAQDSVNFSAGVSRTLKRVVAP
ncbi:unnamed protein product [Miscanthus lutarioriparius]|uniref:Uncharacterized protein n=1 Tax=Miscanthus lutarioriparius TaxID=422564 RepID=A0A811PM60_9POAL|nr:unnamed protein product [Miscanthus lutarioriparius]